MIEIFNIGKFVFGGLIKLVTGFFGIIFKLGKFLGRLTGVIIKGVIGGPSAALKAVNELIKKDNLAAVGAGAGAAGVAAQKKAQAAGQMSAKQNESKLTKIATDGLGDKLDKLRALRNADKEKDKAQRGLESVELFALGPQIIRGEFERQVGRAGGKGFAGNQLSTALAGLSGGGGQTVNIQKLELNNVATAEQIFAETDKQSQNGG